MKAFFLSTTAATALLACAATPIPPALEQGAAQATTSQTVVRPLSGIAITQCNLLVVGYVTMPDGTVRRFDIKSNDPISSVLALLQSASHFEQADLPCDFKGAT